MTLVDGVVLSADVLPSNGMGGARMVIVSDSADHITIGDDDGFVHDNGGFIF